MASDIPSWGIPLTKQIACGMSNSAEDVKLPGLESKAAGGPTKAKSGYLKDHERGAAPPIGGNQANPDHGPH